MIKLVILDFYGVIYSNFNWHAIEQRISPDEGKLQKFAHLKNLSNKGKITNAEFMSEVAKLAQDSKNSEDPAVVHKPHVNYELIGLIRESLPGAKIALLSNGNRPDVVSQLNEWGMMKDFDFVFTSSDMQMTKPQLGAYKYVFKEAGVSEDEAIIIDDSPNHTAATVSYGFNAIKFESNDELKAQLKEYT